MATQSVIRPVARSQSRKALTPQEILKVLKIASESKRNLAMIVLAYRHGMRASEVCDLRLSDLDLKNGEVTIRRLKGSLRTVQPLSEHPGQPLLSEKRFCERGLPCAAMRVISCSRAKRAGGFTARNSFAYSSPSPSARDFPRIGGIRTASSTPSDSHLLRGTYTYR
jgi:integrase